MALSTGDWKQFIKEAGIPVEEAKEYAKTFHDNRIQKPEDLSRDILKELGIIVIGEAIAIIKAASSSKSNRAHPANSDVKSHFKPKIDLPRIKSQMTTAEFRKFKLDWQVYKSITQLPTDQIAPQLYTACDGDVQNSIMNTSAHFLKDDEDTNLSTIESIVTRQSNPAVHRLAFSNITQSENELITAFVVRLKSAARDCEYECPACQKDISDSHIRDQLIRGLHNSTLQTDILAKWSSLTKLDDIIKYAQAFESAVRDQSNLTDQAEAMKISDYQKKKRRELFENKDKPRAQRGFPSRIKCQGCGSTRHQNKSRSAACPAWGQKCHNCGKMNHFASQCKGDIAHEIREETETDYECLHVDIDEVHPIASICSVEEIPAKIKPETKKGSPEMTSMIFPDSGASICLAGTHYMTKLGISNEDLTKCQKKSQSRWRRCTNMQRMVKCKISHRK